MRSIRLELIALGSFACLFPAPAQTNVTMSRYDNATTAANLQEKVLNTQNVQANGFGKLYSYYVDGAVFAQPLYISSQPITGRGTHNVLFIATMNDKIYAFDADHAGPPLWMRTLTDEMAGITPVPIVDITNNNDLNLVGNIGIGSTPVIDRAAGAMYLLARTKEKGQYVQRLHKLALKDGKDLSPPATIEASVKSTAKDAVNGVLSFDPKGGNQRPALALVKGMLVIAWASHEDIRPYHGWIMAYHAANLQQAAVFCTTPDGADGGVWQSGRGPAMDAAGEIYFETGNGSWDGKRNFGTSLIKLGIRGNSFQVDDYFTPHDYQALNDRDADLGSTGPLLVPGTDILICGSKTGIFYLFHSGKLGHMTADNAGVIQTLEVEGGRFLAGPAFWNGPAGPTLYVWAESDSLKGFRFTGDRLASTPFAKGNIASKGSPGGAISISSDGRQPASGIVWATLTNGKSADHGNAAGVLRAYNAETLQELWNSEQRARRDRLGTLVKFVPPTVAAGKVYIPNYDNAVNVYGLLPQ